RVVGEHQAVAALARDDVPVAGRDGQPALVVDRDGGLALEHALSVAPVSGGFATMENHQFPGFPTRRHLRRGPEGCQQLSAAIFANAVNDLRETSETC